MIKQLIKHILLYIKIFLNIFKSKIFIAINILLLLFLYLNVQSYKIIYIYPFFNFLNIEYLIIISISILCLEFFFNKIKYLSLFNLIAWGKLFFIFLKNNLDEFNLSIIGKFKKIRTEEEKLNFIKKLSDIKEIQLSEIDIMEIIKESINFADVEKNFNIKHEIHIKNMINSTIQNNTIEKKFNWLNFNYLYETIYQHPYISIAVCFGLIAAITGLYIYISKNNNVINNENISNKENNNFDINENKDIIDFKENVNNYENFEDNDDIMEFDDESDNNKIADNIKENLKLNNDKIDLDFIENKNITITESHMDSIQKYIQQFKQTKGNVVVDEEIRNKIFNNIKDRIINSLNEIKNNSNKEEVSNLLLNKMIEEVVRLDEILSYEKYEVYSKNASDTHAIIVLIKEIIDDLI
jgi:hypothetical protein